MLLQRLLSIMLVSATLILYMFLSLQSRQIDQLQHTEYIQDLRKIEGLHATLNETVLQVRLGLVSHYDSINTVVNDLDEVRGRLSIVPTYIDQTGVDLINEQLTSYDELSTQKKQAVEDFKTHNSVLNNSLSYFTIVVAEYVDQNSLLAEPTLLESTVDSLLVDILLYNLTGNELLLDEIETFSTALELEQDDVFVDINLDNMITHTDIIIDRTPLVDTSIDDILDTSITTGISDLLLLYESLYNIRIRQAQIFRVAWALLTLSIVGYIAISISLYFRNSAHVLRQTKNQLEITNTERQQVIRELENAQKVKDEFMATMSHELRTPLNAIIGFLGIIEMSQSLDESSMRMITRVMANSERLLSLINDILDISRIESGRFEIVPIQVNLQAFINRLVQQTEVLAQEKNLDFMVRIDEKLPQEINVDEDALQKVITNLLGNAFKFTEEGSVALDVSIHTEGWAITVTDTGIGIPAHMHDTIFERFRQVDGTSTRQYGGSGLGLAIAQKMTTAMNGKVNLESVVDEGSTFTVILPLQESTSSTIN
jgi:signal transduction histidine kinase